MSTVPAPEPVKPGATVYRPIAVLPARPNWPLRSMLIVGGLLMIVGFIWALIGRSSLSRLAGTADLLTLLGQGEAYGQALDDYLAGVSLATLGGALLIIGWAIAAAKHRSEPRRID